MRKAIHWNIKYVFSFPDFSFFPPFFFEKTIGPSDLVPGFFPNISIVAPRTSSSEKPNPLYWRAWCRAPSPCQKIVNFSVWWTLHPTPTKLNPSVVSHIEYQGLPWTGQFLLLRPQIVKFPRSLGFKTLSVSSPPHYERDDNFFLVQNDGHLNNMIVFHLTACVSSSPFHYLF